MKKSLKIFSILVLTFFSLNFAQAQTIDLEINENLTLPSVKVVIDSVLSRNAMLKFRKQHVGVKEFTLASEQIYWTRNFGIQGDTRYGNLNNFSTNGDGQVSSSVLTTTRQFNYSIGFYIKIPIFDVLNRKNQVGLARLEVEEAKSMAQFQEDEIAIAIKSELDEINNNIQPILNYKKSYDNYSQDFESYGNVDFGESPKTMYNKNDDIPIETPMNFKPFPSRKNEHTWIIRVSIK